MNETIPRAPNFWEFALATDSVAEAYDNIISRLAIHYCLLLPEKRVADFHEEILKPLANSTPDAPASIEIPPLSETFKAYMTLLLDACALSITAFMADEAGEPNAAWRHVNNAMFKLGKLEGLLLVEPAINHIVKGFGSKGAKKRSAKREPLRELARKLAMEGNYPNASEAAKGIKDRVLAAQAKTVDDSFGKPVRLSQDRAKRTIETWLKDLPFPAK
jgi:hypothetical protein